MEFIYDRTEADVEYALNNQDSTEFLKGAYNYTDLNRVELNCSMLADMLNEYNYFVEVQVKTDWDMLSIPTVIDMERIRTNVRNLKEAYYSYTNVPDSLNNLTYQKANDIEKILAEIDYFIPRMIAEFRQSGTFYSAESEGLI